MSVEQVNLKTTNFVHWLDIRSISLWMTSHPQVGMVMVMWPI